jgi:uncharacterized protein with HEPN domain
LTSRERPYLLDIQYDGIQLERIWRVLEAELPAIIAALDPLFPERSRS